MLSLRPKATALLATAVLACGAVMALPASASATIKLGIFNSGAPGNAQTVADYTTLVGRQPDIVMWYQDFGNSLLTSKEISTLNETGQAPMVTWEPYDQSLSSIANGSYDSYLRQSAQAAKAWGGELMIRFAHEMNGTWYPWSRSSSYVSAWRHIVSVFRAEGATNVRWVWAPNVDRTGAMPFSSYFPGEEWVDYVGLDGYNWGATPENTWQSLEQVFSASYAKITALSAKPLIITETASSEIGGDKAAWIRTGFMKTIPQQFPRVTGVIWFNKAQEDNWPLTSSEAALNAYRAVVACSLYGGSGPCEGGEESSGGKKRGKKKLAVRSLRVTRRVSSPAKGAVSYGLTDAAQVRIEIVPRGRPAKRFRVLRHSHRGHNRVALERLVRRHRLRAGSYRVVISARNREGDRSRPRKDHFRVT
jgi:Glycosyl hydrolase family 26